MPSPRQIARMAVASAFYASGGFEAILKRQAESGAVCILGLHRVLTEEEMRESHSEPAIILRKDVFAELCKFLQRHFEVVTLASVLAGDATISKSKPRCVLTFDDGWRDNYSNALPVLREFGFVATIFLATAMMDSESTFWVERVRSCASDEARWRRLREHVAMQTGKPAEQLAPRDVTEHLKRMSTRQREQIIIETIGTLPPPSSSDHMLKWEQVMAMSRDGMDFGSHTDTHPLLPYETPQSVDEELRVSRQKLEARLISGSGGFAYPNGSWNDKNRHQVRDAGYTCAVTTQAGWFRPGDDAFCMPRILLHDGSVTGPNDCFSPAAAAFSLTGWR
ncbi:MAG: polysaccharide deacetylase family protein [Candidatus Korobacteraceae bacterium]